MKALCHCLYCRKITGSTYSTNIALPNDAVVVDAGSPKTVPFKDPSGNVILTNYFCGDCGTTLFQDGPAFPGMKLVKAGIMDDIAALGEAKPGLELYTKTKVSWVANVDGAVQKELM
jgi:hypothetical protein